MTYPNTIPEKFFADIADYDFDIVVTGKDTPTVRATVRVSWSGKWDQMKVQNVTGRVPAVRPEVAPAA